jgi:hypothetical protein
MSGRMDSKSRLEIVPSRLAAALGELPTTVLKMARLCDGSRNLEALCSASRLPEEEVTPIVRRLVSLGVVRESAARKPQPLSEKALAWAHGRSQPAFSDEEEQFFASPIDHLVEE